MIERDPAIDARDRVHRTRRNAGNIFMALKPLDERNVSAQQRDRSTARLARPAAGGVGVLAGRAGPAHRRPAVERAVPVHDPVRHARRSRDVGPAAAREACASCPASPTSTPISRTAGSRPTLTYDRTTRGRARRDAAAARHRARHRVRPGRRLRHLPAGELLLRRARGRAGARESPEALRDVYIRGTGSGQFRSRASRPRRTRRRRC